MHLQRQNIVLVVLLLQSPFFDDDAARRTNAHFISEQRSTLGKLPLPSTFVNKFIRSLRT